MNKSAKLLSLILSASLASQMISSVNISATKDSITFYDVKNNILDLKAYDAELDTNHDGNMNVFDVIRANKTLIQEESYTDLKEKVYMLETQIESLYQKLNEKTDTEEGKQLSSNDFTDEEKQKLECLNNYDDTEIKTEINNQNKLIDSLVDIAKEEKDKYDSVISNIEYSKVDKEEGKLLSSNDYTDEEKLNNEIVFNSYYKQSINQRLHSLSKGALIFTVDDGTENDARFIFPLIDEFDIPFTFACWSSSWLIENKIDELLTLISEKNCEVAQHTTRSYTGMDYIESYNILKAEKEAFKSKGITIENYIYGYNQTDDNLKYTASALYDYAAAGVGNLNDSNMLKYQLNRTWITWKNTDSFKAGIDKCIAENKIMIIGIHSSELADEDTMTKLIDIIRYAKSKDISITNLKGIKLL